MCNRIWKVFVLPLVAFFVLCFHPGAFQLRKEDVRKTMEEMLTYHVEYKEFSALIARRSLKVYVEQFDPDRVYLLSSEAKPYLEPKEDKLKSVIQKYYQDDLSEYTKLSQMLKESIVRSRAYREGIEEELIESDENPQFVGGAYLDYARNEKELKERIRKQLTRALWIEKQANHLSALDAHQRKKIFALWEKRFARSENTYLPESKTDHNLCMHVLKAFAKSLDAHTSYYSPEEAYEMRTSLEKQFEGIGVVLRESIDGVVIHDTIKGGPAERCGKIAPGDLLVEIDGQTVEKVSYEEVLKRLQGDGKGKIQIGLQRYLGVNNTQMYRVDLKREKIVMQDDRVQYSFERFADGIIGKISLPSFYESGEGSTCEIEMRNALKALKRQGNLIGLVLDMRENSGGFLNQAVKVAGLFVSSGVIVISKYARGETQYLRDLDGRSYYSGPLVILTSKGSASAAEIVAQALQDYGTGLVVGDERTYGKGTIQYQTVTDSGASSFFKVTVGRYYTVSGRSTQIEGVKADVVVPTAYSMLNIGERYLEFPLKNDRIPSAYTDPLTDIDPRNQQWFQKNYLPNLQKKLSLWTQMLPQLRDNSTYRLQKNKDYTFFLKVLDQDKNRQSFTLTAQENWGVQDLQMVEAVNILKDMSLIKVSSPQKTTTSAQKNAERKAR
jgi:carboxyl-terminal processing protease